MTHTPECLLLLAQHCLKHLRQIKQIHSFLITSGHLHHHPNPPSHLKWKCTLFYNALIRAHHVAGLTHKVMFLFTYMLSNQAPPNSHTFPPLIKSASSSPLRLGTSLHSQVIKRGVFSDLFIQTTLIVLYARNKNLHDARKVFKEIPLWCIVACNAMLDAFCSNGNMEDAISFFECMPDRDVVSWTTIINGFAAHRRFCAAIRVFWKMMTHEDVVNYLVKPNEATYVSVLSSCTNLYGKAGLDYGKQVHGYIVMNEINLGVFVGTSLIDLYGKMGCLNYAVNVFKQMVSREACTWNAIISSLASNGKEKDALDMFEKMKVERLQPNSITFVAVLTACARGKFVKEGMKLFQLMLRDFKVVPIMEHYGCLIDLLGKAGYLQEAAEIIKNMPFQPDASILGAFLGACRIHEAIELGEEIGRKWLKLQSQYCGQYVLLSGMNAEKERWDLAANMRYEIMEAGIRKIPAYSTVHLT